MRKNGFKNAGRLLALLLIAALLHVPAGAKSDTDLRYGSLYYQVGNNEVTITGCAETATSLSIPKTIDGYPVTVISEGAFLGCAGLRHVTLPEGLKRLGAVFLQGTGVTELTIPTTLVWNSAATPLKNSNVTKVIFAADSTTVPAYICQGAEHLTEVQIPESVTSIESCAFFGCVHLTSIKLPRHLESIGSYVFSGCTNLMELDLPDTLKYVGNAFIQDTPLKQLSVPAGVVWFATYQYPLDGSGVELVQFRNGIETIPAGFCKGAEKLKKLILPDSVTMIGSEAFRDCVSLQYIAPPNDENPVPKAKLPPMLNQIGEYAFKNCRSLEYILTPDPSVVYGSPTDFLRIRNHAFEDCTALEIIVVGEKTVYYEDTFTRCRSVQLPGQNSVTLWYRPRTDGNSWGEWAVWKTLTDKSRFDPLSAEQINGFRLEGWYPNKEQKKSAIMKASDIKGKNLYAFYSDNAVRLDTDVFPFSNSPIWFSNGQEIVLDRFGEEIYDYSIKRSDMELLIRQDESKKKMVYEKKDHSWNGSCFGMSVAVCLSKYYPGQFLPFIRTDKGRMLNGSNGSIKYDNTSAKTMRDLLLPSNKNDMDVSFIESKINMYQLSQYLKPSIIGMGKPSYAWTQTNDWNEVRAANIPEIVHTLEDRDDPTLPFVLMVGMGCMELSDGGNHAVVGTGFSSPLQVGNETFYTFQIYDCSVIDYYYSLSAPGEPEQVNKLYTVTIMNQNGKWSVSYPEWEEAWKKTTKEGDVIRTHIWFQEAIPIETYVEVNQVLIDEILSPYKLSSGQTNNRNSRNLTSGESQADISLSANYASFEISGASASAVIVSGQKTAGDLDITLTDTEHWAGFAASYVFSLPVSESGYTIRLTQPPAEGTVLRTSLYGSTVYADGTGSITLTPDGTVRTADFSDGAEQLLFRRGALQNGDTSLDVWLLGDGAGMSWTPAVGGATLSSDKPLQLSVQEDGSEVVFETIPVGGAQLGTEGRDVYVISADTQLRQRLGYTVFFETGRGSQVRALTDVVPGTVIPAPEEPTLYGSAFSGWYRDETHETPWNFDSVAVDGALTLYAKWTPKEALAVTFRMPNREEEALLLYSGEDADAADYPTLLLPEGFVFRGWSGAPTQNVTEDIELQALADGIESVDLLTASREVYVDYCAAADSLLAVASYSAGGQLLEVQTAVCPAGLDQTAYFKLEREPDADGSVRAFLMDKTDAAPRCASAVFPTE